MADEKSISGRDPTPVVISDIVRKSVCKITIANDTATGFLLRIQPNAVDELLGLLTNNHVISHVNVAERDSCYLQFQYLPSCDVPIKFDLAKMVYFYSNDKAIMDATFIQLPLDLIRDLNKAGAVWLSIDHDDAKAGEKIFIIQHPAAQLKGTLCEAGGTVESVSLEQDKDGNTYTFIKHSVSTGPGSSGSPVVTQDGRLIGLHRRSNKDSTNGATNARCIMKALQKHYSKKDIPYGSFPRNTHETSNTASSSSKATAGGHASSSNSGQTDPIVEHIKDFTEDELMRKIKSNHAKFGAFDPKGSVLKELAGKGIITQRKMDELNRINNPEDRCNEFMSHLHDVYHSKKCATFLTILYTSEDGPHKELVKAILDTQIE